jgi:hypothetical protein
MATTAVLTAKGRDIVTSNLNGTAVTAKVIGWGLVGATPNAAATDVALYKEAPEARVTGTSSVVTTTTANDTYQVTGTMTCTQSGGETISEVAIVDATSKPFTTTWATAPSGSTGTSGTTSAAYSPANNTYIQDQSGEVMQVTAGTGTTSLTVARGANGSTAVASANGNTITQGAVPGSSVTGGNLLMHATFTGLALSNGDSIAFTLQVKFT